MVFLTVKGTTLTMDKPLFSPAIRSKLDQKKARYGYSYFIMMAIYSIQYKLNFIVRMDRNGVNTFVLQVCYCGAGEQDVLCINERQVIIRSKAMYEQPNVSMEGINSDLSNR
jgi:hypothetical protein